MATMNVSLPDEMKSWVESQTGDGQYGNASDYVRDLIRRDRDRKRSMAWLQEQIDIGLKSGVSTRTFDEIIDDAKRQAELRGLLRG